MNQVTIYYKSKIKFLQTESMIEMSADRRAEITGERLAMVHGGDGITPVPVRENSEECQKLWDEIEESCKDVSVEIVRNDLTGMLSNEEVKYLVDESGVSARRVLTSNDYVVFEIGSKPHTYFLYVYWTGELVCMKDSYWTVHDFVKSSGTQTRKTLTKDDVIDILTNYISTHDPREVATNIYNRLKAK